MKTSNALLIVVGLILLTGNQAFLVRPGRARAWTNHHHPRSIAVHDGEQQRRSAITKTTASTTQLQGNPDKIQGTDRGTPILIFVMAACIWIFSIPPEFRRAYICAGTPCLEQRSLCNDCVTVTEWKDGILDYYKNGGGVQFDFSIDPKSKAAFDEQLGFNKK